ncbi:MAG TPA: phasin family protein [Candidatus Limnocylindrales bacterium]|nr:phasin family protein [Candidatus Limnocylindrales bacterium]
MVMDEVRRYMEAAMGAMGRLTPANAQDLAKAVAKGQGREQVKRTAKDLLEWSNKNRERLTDLVRSEVRSQVKTLGLATRDDVDALRKRVRDLERGGKPAGKRSTAKRRTAKRSTAKPATAAASEPSSAGTEV